VCCRLIACSSIMKMMMNKTPKLDGGTKFRKRTFSLINGSSIDNFDKKAVYYMATALLIN
jgi:hypothetical protein